MSTDKIIRVWKANDDEAKDEHTLANLIGELELSDEDPEHFLGGDSCWSGSSST
jgi:hypothetical protein